MDDGLDGGHLLDALRQIDLEQLKLPFVLSGLAYIVLVVFASVALAKGPPQRRKRRALFGKHAVTWRRPQPSLSFWSATRRKYA